MPDLSVIIPARKEQWLLQTVQSIRAAIRGDTEIIVVIDGEEDGPPLPDVWPAGPEVRVIRNLKSLGQRQAINQAARASSAKFILKTDAHSLLDEGFDLKLMADCERDWTVIPRMYNLHSHDEVCYRCGERYYNRPPMSRCEKCGTTEVEGKAVMSRQVIWQRNMKKPPTDFMYFRSPTAADMPMRVQYWDGPTKREFPAEHRAWKRWSRKQPEIADVMTGQGACFFMHRERFWGLGGLDEAHGHWGQMGVELACKAWLSGGRQVVNRKTWFAHLFRCGGSEGCPWEMDGRQQEAARQYSIDLWSNNKWLGQKRPLEWIVDKFWPVPTWDKPDATKINAFIESHVGGIGTSTNTTPCVEAWKRESVEAGPSIGSIGSTGSPIPKVSVLIPARNEPYLDATVRDLLQNLRLDFEILVGLDGPDQPPLKIDDGRIRVIRSADRIGMRPMINRLAREARGEYLLRMDAHCMVAEGIDEALVGLCEREGHVTAVAKRYELDAKTWTRRDRTDTPCRRLTHESEDGCGLRSLPWPEYDAAHADEEISETMTCSGSSWTCRRETFLGWGGFDERHGTFGQEGCEIACMTWLSGGRFLVHKGTWYAHHNRNKATYALGASVKSQSIEWSNKLWRGNLWPHATRPFQWLIEKFQPPGWPGSSVGSTGSIVSPATSDAIPAIRQGALTKGWKCRVGTLYDHRQAISDPGKAEALAKFWPAFDTFIRANPPYEEQKAPYREYLITRLSRKPVTRPTDRQLRKIEARMADDCRLAADIAAHGLKAPLEFYADGGRLILWKGYRRLAILHALGRDKEVVPCRVFADRRAAGVLSSQNHLTRLVQSGPDDLHRIAEAQFNRLGREASDKYWVHGYTRYYDRHFAAIRGRAKRICEVGLLNGSSLALWREYFPKADLFGFDMTDRWKRHAGSLERCTVIQGDETNRADVQRLIDQGPFDVIVDDASHDPAHQRQLFDQLWPSVRQYGFYVIEDIYRSFRPESTGSTGSAGSPCLPAGLESRLYQQRDVLSIHWYYNIVFIQKA